MCAVFWESSYSDMLVYILCTFTITLLPPLLLIIICSLLTWAGYGKNCARYDINESCHCYYDRYICLLLYFKIVLSYNSCSCPDSNNAPVKQYIAIFNTQYLAPFQILSDFEQTIKIQKTASC